MKTISKAKLVECFEFGRKWDFNRQLSEAVKGIPDGHFPVVWIMEHNHRHGVECEPHMRLGVQIGERTAFVDVPMDFFESLELESANR